MFPQNERLPEHPQIWDMVRIPCLGPHSATFMMFEDLNLTLTLLTLELTVSEAETLWFERVPWLRLATGKGSPFEY